MISPLTDAVLVTQTLDGNSRAYTQLVERYRNAIYGLAYYRLQNFEDAQDVAQEVFIHAYRQLNQLREPAKFGPWLRRVTITQCAMWQRRQHHTEPLDESLAVTSHTSEVESRLVVQQALACLPEESRLTIILFYFKSYSMQEIADFLEVPVTTIKSRLRDARARMKKELLEMVESTLQENILPGDFVEKVGRIIQTQDTFVKVQFTPDTMPGLFTMLKFPDPWLADDCHLAVVEHLENGQVLCITLPPTYCLPGIEAVVSKDNVDVNLQNEHGVTALSSAVILGWTNIVRSLLEKGADANLTDKHGSSALIYAAMYNHLDIALLLLEHNADVNAIPEYRNTALMYAAGHGNVEMVKALLTRGADVAFQTPAGTTSRMVAEQKAESYLEVAKLLQQAEAGN